MTSPRDFMNQDAYDVQVDNLVRLVEADRHRHIAMARIDEHEWIKDNSEQLGNAGTGDVHEYRFKTETSDDRIAEIEKSMESGEDKT